MDVCVNKREREKKGDGWKSNIRTLTNTVHTYTKLHSKCIASVTRMQHYIVLTSANCSISSVSRLACAGVASGVIITFSISITYVHLTLVYV